MTTKAVMVIETDKCVGCSACVISCKLENDVPDDCYRDWVTTETNGTFPNLKMEHRSERCNHCSNAPCVSNCPTGASYVEKDGTVQVDRNKCSGCKNCLSACPYNARYVDPRGGFVDKCTFCPHLPDTTGCVEICPTNCLHFGDIHDPDSEVSRLLRSRQVKVLKENAGTRPNVYYVSQRR